MRPDNATEIAGVGSSVDSSESQINLPVLLLSSRELGREPGSELKSDYWWYLE